MPAGSASSKRAGRASLLALAGLVLLGLAISFALRGTSELGRYVGDSPVAVQILQDRRSPAAASGAADLAVVVFTDYQCPVCRRVDPAFNSAIARDGNLRVIYKDWPIFGERSEAAARGALAAHRQGLYLPVHRALMRAPSVDEAALRRAVESAGGDWRQLEADRARRAPAIARDLAANDEQAFSLGLAGTPGFLVGPYLVEGALTEDEFLRVFAQARARLSGNP